MADKLFTTIHKLGLTRALARHSRFMREELAKGVDYNPILLTHEMCPFDMITDSLNYNILPQPLFFSKGDYEMNFIELEETLKEFTGLKFAFPVAHGRSAEWFLSKLIPLEGKSVITNSLFPTTRIHLQEAGAKVVEHTNNGIIDLQSLPKILSANQEAIGAIYMETADNSQGGVVFSLEHLREVSSFARKNHIPLVIDGCRILDHVYMLRETDSSLKELSLREIVSLVLKETDFLTMSLTKNFLLEKGALIAFNDEIYKSKMQDLLMIMGDGLSVRDKALINKTLKRGDSYIIKRAKKVKKLASYLNSKNIPILQTKSSFAVYLDTSKIKECKKLGDFPIQSFLIELYIRSGILLTENAVTPDQENNGVSLVRIILPLDTYRSLNLKYIAEQITKLFKDFENIRPLSLVSKSDGRSSLYTAKFSR